MNIQNQRLVTYNSSDGSYLTEQYIQGYQKYQVLFAAIELGLFKYLEEKGNATRDEISQSLNINGMFTRSFLQTLTDMGMLQQENSSYSNTDISRKLFSYESISYRGDWFKNAGAKTSKWNNLVDTLTKETPAPDVFSAGPGKEFIQYLAQRSMRGELQAVVKAIIEWDGFKQTKSLIDIGGGHGLYAIALCQENDDLTAAIFDKPFVNEYANDYITTYQMTNRVKTLDGDITTDEITGEYDIVLISHLLYKFRKDLPAIFHKVNRCLKPGGLFVSNHWFCETGCLPGQNGVVELDKAMHSFGHPLCHIETFNQYFNDEGFTVISEKDIPSEFGNSKLHLSVKDLKKKPNPDQERNSHSCCCD